MLCLIVTAAAIAVAGDQGRASAEVLKFRPDASTSAAKPATVAKASATKRKKSRRHSSAASRKQPSKAKPSKAKRRELRPMP